MEAMRRGGVVPPWFMTSRMILIPKGSEAQDGDDQSATRDPAATRLVQLSNVDSNVVAVVVDRRLAEVAPRPRSVAMRSGDLSEGG